MDDNQSSVEEVIMQFDRNENSVLDIPEECRDNIQVIKAERRNGLRITTERGYDVITDRFFVKEDTTVTEKYLFQTFEEYYDFLNGDIYQDACYRFYNFPVEIISKYSLDVCKMKENRLLLIQLQTIILRFLKMRNYNIRKLKRFMSSAANGFRNLMTA